jgi:hypothetical protein
MEVWAQSLDLAEDCRHSEAVAHSHGGSLGASRPNTVEVQQLAGVGVFVENEGLQAVGTAYREYSLESSAEIALWVQGDTESGHC